MSELIGLLAGFILTLCIFSYLLGDNGFYRLAVHVLVGVSAAYAAVIAVRDVFLPLFARFQDNPGAPGTLLWLVPLLFALLLVLKWIRPVAWIGNGAIAVLVGVGAAVALVGAISGTLLPQMTNATSDNAVLNLLAAVLTGATLLYFQFTGRKDAEGEMVRPAWHRYTAGLGRAVLMITFGALFAGVLNTSLVVLAERLSFYLNEFTTVFGNFLS